MPVGARAEEVAIMTLGLYAGRAGLDQLALVEIGTEGHDLAVLRGARELFASQRISVAQFKFNHCSGPFGPGGHG